jgi:hypothetical protein
MIECGSSIAIKHKAGDCPTFYEQINNLGSTSSIELFDHNKIAVTDLVHSSHLYPDLLLEKNHSNFLDGVTVLRWSDETI